MDGAGCDPDGRRIERPVDAVGRIDQEQPGARDAVAVVLDHELERGPMPGPLDGLEGDDPAVVERQDAERGLGDDRIVLGGGRDDPDGDLGRPGRGGGQQRWA